MILKLAYYGNPILRKKCRAVDSINDEIRNLIEDMVETMIEHNGIGLAAPQVNRDLRIFITAVPVELSNDEWEKGELLVFINPKIVSVSKESAIRQEGCLSIPKVYGDVSRPTRITIQAQDINGNSFEREYTGLQARCCLHENDHLNGVLYLDRMLEKERKLLNPLLKKVKDQYNRKP